MPRPGVIRKIALRAVLLALGLSCGLLFLEMALRVASLFVSTGEEKPLDRTHRSGGVFRILSIGESTTHGLGHDPYPAQLERILNERQNRIRVEVYNEGVPGIETGEVLRRFPNNLAKYEPDLVIAMLGINDPRGFVAARSPILSLLHHSRAFRLFEGLLEAASEKPPPTAKTAFDRILSELRRATAAGEDPLYLRALRQRAKEMASREDVFAAVEIALDDVLESRDPAALDGIPVAIGLWRLRNSPDGTLDERAAQWLEEALEVSPNAEILDILFELYLRIGAAPDRDERAVASFRGWPCEALGLQFHYLLKSNRFESAYRKARQAVDSCSEPMRHRFAAERFLESGRVADAARIFEAGGHIDSGNFQKAGDAYFSLGDYANALRAYEKVAVLQDRVFLYGAGTPLREIAVTGLLAEKSPEERERFGNATGQKGAGEPSRPAFTEPEKIELLLSHYRGGETSADLRAIIGKRLLQIPSGLDALGGPIEKRIAELREAPVLLELARELQERERIRDAEHALEAATRDDPELQAAHLELAGLRWRNNRPRDAERSFASALRLVSGGLEARSLAETYHHLRIEERRIATLEAIARSGLADTALHEIIASAYVEAGDPDAATNALLRGAVEYPNLYGFRGTILYKQGRRDEAVTDFGRMALFQGCFPRAGRVDDYVFCPAIEALPLSDRETLASALGYSLASSVAYTTRNYRAIVSLARRSGARVIAMQYPRRDVQPLRDMLSGVEGVEVVENRERFETELENRSFEELFYDNFAGDFGHCSPFGNFLIADNLAGIILPMMSQSSRDGADTAP